MTDGTQDRMVVAEGIEAARRAQEARLEGLRNGTVIPAGEEDPEAGALFLPPAPPAPLPAGAPADAPDARAPSGEDGATAALGMPAPDAAPPPAGETFTPARLVVMALFAVVLALVWRAVRRARKEAARG